MNRLILIFFSLLALSLSLSIAAMEIVTWSLMALAAVQIFKNRNFRDLKLGPDWALLLYAVTVTISVFVMPPTILSNLQILGFLRWIILLYAMTYLLRELSRPQVNLVLKFLMAGLCLAGIYGVFEFFTGIEFFRPHRLILYPYGDYFRATGFFSGSLTYAYSLGLGGLFLSGWIFSKESRRKSFISLVVSGLGVGASMTRGAWIGFLAGLLCLWSEVSKKWRWISLGVAFIVFLGLFTASASLRHRVESVFDENVGSNRQRRALWHSNWEIFKDHPLIGVGLTRNSEYLPEYYKKLGYDDITFVGHAHSNYLQILVGSGIFAFLAYMFFSLYFFILAWRLWRKSPRGSWEWGLGLGAFTAQVFFHLGGLTECNFTDGEVNHMLIFIWAILISQSVVLKKVPHES